MRGLAIVVNYNQADEIEAFLRGLLAARPAALDLVVVDDGSTDSSPAIATRLGLQVLRHDHNRGVGAAIRTGIDHAVACRYDFVVILSSNGKMCPDEIPRITGPILRNEADYVQGSRFLGAGASPKLPTFRRLAIPLATWLANRTTGRANTDITCGYRAYRLDLLASSQINLHQDWLDRYELEHYLHFWVCRLGLRMREVPVTIHYEHLPAGRRSKIRPVLDWWSIVRPFFLLALGVRH